ncbi:MAG: dihydrofolate reductase [Anaerolineales bacterium]
MIVSIIVAMAEPSRAIGLRGGLPWRLPADLARFKQRTLGHTLIMGRTTWEPLSGRGLPGRRIIVLSRTGLLSGNEIKVASSLNEALGLARNNPAETETLIAGGAQVYRAALAQDVVDRMYLTLVHAELEADTYFPPYEQADWETSAAEHRPADAENPYDVTFTTLERKAGH